MRTTITGERSPFEIGFMTFAEITADSRTGALPSAHQRAQETIEQARVADEVGLDLFAVGEHHRIDFIGSAPPVVLAAAAQATTNIRLTSAVTVLSSDDPVRVWGQFATLDQLSGAGPRSSPAAAPTEGRELSHRPGLSADTGGPSLSKLPHDHIHISATLALEASRGGRVATLHPADFTIAVPDHDITDLRHRLSSTRWPRAWPDAAWSAGTDMGVLARLVDYWADGFDWHSHERRLNAEPQRIATVSSQKVHFLHVRAEDPTGFPMILTNGWPSTFSEMIPLAHRLAGLGHDVVVPSLPGFIFSDQPAEAPAEVPTYELWHRLMTGLGYHRYVAHGGDLGAGVTSRLGAAHPEAVAGIHLMAVMAAADHSGLTAAEEAYLSGIESWTSDGGAYQHQQQTRPLTLAYGLSDSPAGLLAWILEKYRAWSDCDGDVTTRWSDDEILVQASLYWFTNTIGTSFRPYFDHLAHPMPRPVMGDVPTAVTAFPYDISVPPREYAERTYHVVRYTRFDHGGHFAPHEEPELLARDIHEFATALSV